MTKQEFDAKYVKREQLVFCYSKSDSDTFRELAHSFGYKWFSNKSLATKDYWGERSSGIGLQYRIFKLLSNGVVGVGCDPITDGSYCEAYIIFNRFAFNNNNNVFTR